MHFAEVSLKNFHQELYSLYRKNKNKIFLVFSFLCVYFVDAFPLPWASRRKKCLWLPAEKAHKRKYTHELAPSVIFPRPFVWPPPPLRLVRPFPYFRTGGRGTRSRAKNTSVERLNQANVAPSSMNVWTKTRSPREMQQQYVPYFCRGQKFCTDRTDKRWKRRAKFCRFPQLLDFEQSGFFEELQSTQLGHTKDHYVSFFKKRNFFKGGNDFHVSSSIYFPVPFIQEIRRISREVRTGNMYKCANK